MNFIASPCRQRRCHRGGCRQYTAVVLVTEGVFAVVALVLVVGGFLKLRDPRPTKEMLEVLGVPAPDQVTHVSAGVEVALGLVAVLFGGTLLASLIAVVYAVFAVMMVLLVRKGNAASTCGCFGSISSRPSLIHVVVDVLAACVASVAAVSGVRGAVDYREDLVGGGVPQFVAVVAGCLFVVAVMTVGPNRSGKRRSSRRV